MCCCLSGEPIEDQSGRIKTFNGRAMFQTGKVLMLILKLTVYYILFLFFI